MVFLVSSRKFSFVVSMLFFTFLTQKQQIKTTKINAGFSKLKMRKGISYSVSLHLISK